jgi:hypothetical protein
MESNLSTKHIGLGSSANKKPLIPMKQRIPRKLKKKYAA